MICDKQIKKNRIVLFTSNFSGGILQFTMELYLTIPALGYETVVFVPDNAVLNPSYMTAQGTVRTYPRQKSLKIRNETNVRIARSIEEHNPDIVLFCDTAIISMQVSQLLKKEIYKAAFLHDVLPHPTWFQPKKILNQFFTQMILKQTMRSLDQIIMLSKHSYNLFIQNYSRYAKKAIWMPLGAHVPRTNPVMPKELELLPINKGFYLFFGRIDKYKGIFRLLKSYNKYDSPDKPMLIIAGSGQLKRKEKMLIRSNEKIVLINRFLNDGEMIFLIENSLSVILPYIEASQSGVLPIAYHLGTPVIVSDVEGLTEFVDHNKTGIICTNEDDFVSAMRAMQDDAFRRDLKKNIKSYYQKSFNWQTNLERLLKGMEKSMLF